MGTGGGGGRLGAGLTKSATSVSIVPRSSTESVMRITRGVLRVFGTTGTNGLVGTDDFVAALDGALGIGGGGNDD